LTKQESRAFFVGVRLLAVGGNSILAIGQRQYQPRPADAPL